MRSGSAISGKIRWIFSVRLIFRCGHSNAVPVIWRTWRSRASMSRHGRPDRKNISRSGAAPTWVMHRHAGWASVSRTGSAATTTRIPSTIRWLHRLECWLLFWRITSMRMVRWIFPSRCGCTWVGKKNLFQLRNKKEVFVSIGRM